MKDGRPCERCGNADKMGDAADDLYEVDTYNNRPPALCSEIQMAFGLLGWLCHDCRKEYHRMAKNSPLTIQYGEASLRLDFWKARVGPSTPPDHIKEGLVLWRQVEKLEREISEVANQWLISDLDAQRSL